MRARTIKRKTKLVVIALSRIVDNNKNQKCINYCFSSHSPCTQYNCWKFYCYALPPSTGVSQFQCAALVCVVRTRILFRSSSAVDRPQFLSSVRIFPPRTVAVCSRKPFRTGKCRERQPCASASGRARKNKTVRSCRRASYSVFITRLRGCVHRADVCPPFVAGVRPVVANVWQPPRLVIPCSPRVVISIAKLVFADESARRYRPR